MQNNKNFIYLVIILTSFLFISGCSSDKKKSPPTDANDGNPPTPCITEEQPEWIKDAGEIPYTSGTVSIDDAEYFCRYNSLFAYSIEDGVQPECKSYPGDFWTKARALADCMRPFGSIEVVSRFSTTPCETDTALATCTADANYNNASITFYYPVVPDPTDDQYGINLATVKSGCEGFAGGIYEGEDVESTPSSPLLPEALTACNSTTTVDVTPDNITDEQLANLRVNGGFILFKPKSGTPTAGVIIYPGGLVDSRAYAPAAQILADNGIAVAILPVPHYMAISPGAQDRSTAVTDDPDNSGITHWFIAGHSVGGVAASQYVYNNERPVDGLIILGAYLSDITDLSTRSDLSALIIISSEETSGTEGTEDYIRYQDGKAYAPPDTTYLIIEGGNHFGFCYQENKRDDEVATITVAEQHTQYTNAIITMIDTKISDK